MSPYWLATIAPLIAVTDSAKELGIAGGLFLVAMALIGIINKFIAPGKKTYGSSDRERDEKMSETLNARDADGMPRVWFPSTMARTMEVLVKVQRDGNQSMSELTRLQREAVEMMKNISDNCRPPMPPTHG